MDRARESSLCDFGLSGERQIVLMDYNLIDIEPIKPGWGRVYQGGGIGLEIQNIPGPLVIVSLDATLPDRDYVDRKHVLMLLSIPIEDAADAILPDDAFIASIEAGIDFLSRGINLYVRCLAGVSRSSYYNAGLHMRAMKIDLDASLEYIKRTRPSACPNAGFYAHLKHLEQRLIG